MDTKIRRFFAEDYPKVEELNNSLNRSARGDGSWNEDLRSIEDTYQNKGGEFLIAELDGEVVGMGALLKINNSTVEIKRMRVSKNQQGKGIGRLILNKLEDFARLNKFKRIILDTSVQQISAQRLCEKNGFKEISRKVIDGFDSILYKKYI